MRKIRFADTDESVSVMALGCLAYGTKVDKADSFRQLDYYLEQGGNFLDTANNYSFWDADGRGGESEKLLGDWFEGRKARDKVFLATKLGAFPTVGREEFFGYKGNPWTDLTEGLNADTVVSAVEGSLKRLRTDRIDLLYAHVDDRETDQEETLEAFDRLIRAGKVKYIGCSNFKPWRIVRSREISRNRGWASYKAVQQFYTYFKSEVGTDTGMFDQLGEDLFDYVRSGNTMSLLAYTPLLWGSYTQTHKYREEGRLESFVRPQNDERRKRLEQAATELGWTVNQVIYAWMIASDPPVIPLVAVTKFDHLIEDLATGDLILPEEHLERLNAPLN